LQFFPTATHDSTPEGGTRMWTVIGVGVVAIVAVVIGLAQRFGVRPDLGSVSDQWVAEHRLSQPRDTQR